MPIFHYKTVEIDSGKGWVTLTHTDELEEDLCYLCKGSASRQACAGDGRSHHHGMVHTFGGGLNAVCDSCYADYTREWECGRSVRRLVNQ